MNIIGAKESVRGEIYMNIVLQNYRTFTRQRKEVLLLPYTDRHREFSQS